MKNPSMHDLMWQQIVDEIPSRHLPRHLPVGTFISGYRKKLAEIVAQPRERFLNYLEVGCRLGHSLATVMIASGNTVRATVVDMWISGYGDEPNPGPEAVLYHLTRLAVDTDLVDICEGDSHAILPTLRGPFDLILVDGDHTEEGAEADIRDCAKLLAQDGLMVFDDAVEPLLSVWRRTAKDLGLVSEEHLDTPYPWCTGRWPEGEDEVPQ